MVHIRHEAVCLAPLPVTFGYVDDYRNAGRWMFGLSRLEPVGELDRGLGSVFEGTFHVKPVKLHSTIEVTAWEQDSVIAFDSVKGFRNRSEWRFAEDGPDRTRLQVLFEYELPGGLAGKALGRALEPIVAMSVRHSDTALRHHVEQHHATS